MPDRENSVILRTAEDLLLNTAAIALGSNLGNREQNLHAAIEHIGALGTVTAVSSFLDTAPVGFLDQPRFLNAALLLETALTPLDLLCRLLKIERGMGRDRADVPAKGPRVIDLDLIFYDNLVLNTPQLTLPHPSMHERAFVLAPLAEIAPGWPHPVSQQTAREMLDALTST
jgi:2-amino-4-hydroxy-6-hydroxymethyldihydropteridine diphosphokinase